MLEHQGSCHCGAVVFRFNAPLITEAMLCDCSICRRRGGPLTTFTLSPDSLKIEAREGALRSYKFGTEIATHHFCDTCGIFTFVETRLTPGEYRVNLGCLDDLDQQALDIRSYDASAL